MTRFVCVYKRGAKFTPEYVYRLRNMVNLHGEQRIEFLCVTDHPEVLGYPWTLPLERPEKEGWWALPEKFRIKGPVVFAGLDTIIMDSLAPFIDLAESLDEKTVGMIHCFRFPNKFSRLYANGMMVWNTDLSAIYEEYRYGEARTQYPLEQDYTSAQLIQRGYDIIVLQNRISGIASFKRTCNQGTPPAGTRVVLFHGRPGVAEVADKQVWAKEHWK